MHEILGVEPLELMCYEDDVGQIWFMVDQAGHVLNAGNGELNSRAVCKIVNRPERIIRKPRLTEAQIKILKAALTLGFGWLAKDADGSTFLYEGKPKKEQNYWTNDTQAIKVSVEQVSDLVSWDDPEPLDIAATLKAAGVEA
jgi:hypothetical protein